MKRIALAVALLIAVGVVWRFPLFHVVPLDEAPSINERERVSAAEFAESFWNERLIPSLGESADVADVLAGAARQILGKRATDLVVPSVSAERD